MHVCKWTKHGWKKVVVSKEEQEKYLPRIIHNDIRQDYDNKNTPTEIKQLQTIQEEINYGSPFTAIDDLPPSLQYIIQSPDEWHIGNGKLFRIIDPVTQALVYNEFGNDIEDEDYDPLQDRPSVGAIYLEQNEPSQTISLDDWEWESNGYTSNAPIVPQLSEEMEKIIEKTKSMYVELIDNATTEKEVEKLQKEMEQIVNSIIKPELTTRLDSTYCGYQYSMPGRKYDFIHMSQQSDIQEAAEYRNEFFFDKFSEISSCSSMDELHGPLTVVEEINPETKEKIYKKQRSGGYYATIRGMYIHDKALSDEWSIEDKVDDKGNVVQESAFNKQRKEHIRKLRDKNKDEETIRKSVWAWFDRRKGKVEAEYYDGNLEKTSNSWKDSIWFQKRTKALSSLFMTKAQWNAIFTMMDIIKYRIKLNHSHCEIQDKAIKLLVKGFERINTLDDLNRYRYWAEKRKFIYKEERTVGTKQTRSVLVNKYNTYQFNKSLLDCLSIVNEHRWWANLMKKKKHLIKQIQAAKYMNDNVISEHPTSLEEVAVSCLHPKCNCTGVGVPILAKIRDAKDHMFVRCEGCNRRIWLWES